MSQRLQQLKLATFIALRIARSKRKSTLSLVTLISIVGIACGVMALTVVLAVTDGFQKTFQDRILGIFPHLVVTRASSSFRDYEAILEILRQTEGVVGATPLTGDEMMVANGPYRAGATVEGIDLDSVESTLDLASLVKEGGLAGLGEDPGLEVQGPTRTLRTPVEGVSLTVLQTTQDTPFVLVDDRTTPEADHFRVKALDLRATPGPIALEPIDGTVKTVYEMTAPIEIGGGRAPTPSSKGAWGLELEIPSGRFKLAATAETLALDAGRAYTLVLWTPKPGETSSVILAEHPQARLQEREAAVRVVDLRVEGAALTWAGASGPFVTTNAGEFTGYRAIPARLPGVLLGKALAKKLAAKLGDELTFVTPLRGLDNKMVGPFGMLPSSARFRVAGVFEAGFHDHDSRLVLSNINVSQRFMNRGKLVRSLAVKTASLTDLDRIKARIQRALDPYPFESLIDRAIGLDEKLKTLVSDPEASRIAVPRPDAPFIGGLRNVTEAVGLLKFSGSDSVKFNRFQIFDWKEKNSNLFSALELQKVVLSIFFFIIILVGSFVVVGSQIMVVHEKTPDIAILKTMGGTSGLVRLVFTLQGLFVAVIGLVAGLAVGLGMVAIIDAVDYELEASIYLIDHLPATVHGSELALIAIGTLLCTLVTTQISAGRAAAKTPVAGLRQVD